MGAIQSRASKLDARIHSMAAKTRPWQVFEINFGLNYVFFYCFFCMADAWSIERDVEATWGAGKGAAWDGKLLH